MSRGMTAFAALVMLVSLLTSLSVTAAASTLRIEGESMSLAANLGAVTGNSAASGGKFLMIWANGTATSSVTLPAKATKITLRVKGDQYRGAPRMQVNIDGQRVIDTQVPQTGWTNYSKNLSLNAGAHQLSIAFVNDLYNPGRGDRNLAVDYVEFAVADQAQPTPAPTNPPATPAPTTPPATPAPTTPPSEPGPTTETLPPGSALPSDSTCAARVQRSSWEPRPGNATANHTTGGSLAEINGANAEGNSRFASRISGNFTGTTDEIIQWGACKWGFNPDIVRAVAVKESWWNQSTVGDNGQSFGLLQVKRTVHTGTYPAAQNSTAFNVDYALAWRRSCFEGYFNHWVPASAKGDEWGCVGLWFSGQWYGGGANEYISSVKQYLNAKTWRSSGF